MNGVRGMMALIKMGGEERRESEFLYNGIPLLELPPRFLRSVFCDGIEERNGP